jgi:hypothetical protein
VCLSQLEGQCLLDSPLLPTEGPWPLFCQLLPELPSALTQLGCAYPQSARDTDLIVLPTQGHPQVKWSLGSEFRLIFTHRYMPVHLSRGSTVIPALLSLGCHQTCPPCLPRGGRREAGNTAHSRLSSTIVG